MGTEKHLLVCVHGLFGKDEDLVHPVSVMQKNFEDAESVFVYIPSANNGLHTLEGIVACGDRLVAELRELVAREEHAGLRTISFVGHSLGGLLARYAVGFGFDAAAKTVFGLEPLHYISVATPHFGNNDTYLNDINKEDAVTPCLRWIACVPVIGKFPACLFHLFEPCVVHACLRRCGDELFLRDAPPPVIVRMGTPGDEVPFVAGLASFRERTCYGNIRGDHLVAWENATIRRKCDLPQVDRKAAPWGLVSVEISAPSPGGEAPEPVTAAPDVTSADAASEGEGKQASKATCPRREPLIAALAALGWRRIDVKTKANPGACLSCDCLAIMPHDTILLQFPHKDPSFQAVSESVSDLINASIANF